MALKPACAQLSVKMLQVRGIKSLGDLNLLHQIESIAWRRHAAVTDLVRCTVSVIQYQ